MKVDENIMRGTEFSAIYEKSSDLQFDKVLQEVNLQILKRDGYPIKSNTLKMLVTKRVDFEISSLNIPNISSSNVRLNSQYSDLPKSLVDIVKKNNLYLSN